MANYISNYVLDQIYSMRPPSVFAGEDIVAWRLSKDEVFAHSSEYDSLRVPMEEQHNNIFKLIWKWPGPGSYKFFLWCVGNDSLLTNTTRQRRGLADLGTFPLCNQYNESLLHLLRHCDLVRPSWEYFPEHVLENSFWNQDLKPWVVQNINGGSDGVSHM